MGVAAFICGIISLFILPFLFGTVAIVTGVIGLNNTSEDERDRKLSIAGIALGTASVALQIMVMLMLAAL